MLISRSRAVAWAIGVIAVALCALVIQRHNSQEIDGRYDTSIVGTFYAAAFLEFRGTNVYFCDGRSASTSMGRILRGPGDPVWLVPGGTRWILKRSGRRLLCIDVEDRSNQFLLKPVLFAPARIWVNGLWRRTVDRWSE